MRHRLWRSSFNNTPRSSSLLSRPCPSVYACDVASLGGAYAAALPSRPQRDKRLLRADAGHTVALKMSRSIRDMGHSRCHTQPVARSDRQTAKAVKDTQSSRPHVAGVLLPARPTVPLGLYIPGMTAPLPGEHQPLPSRQRYLALQRPGQQDASITLNIRPRLETAIPIRPRCWILVRHFQTHLVLVLQQPATPPRSCMRHPSCPFL